MFLSPAFARGLTVTAAASLGMLAGFYVQHALTTRAADAFEADVARGTAAGLAARRARVAELEAAARASARK